jgi:hypothetical protein
MKRPAFDLAASKHRESPYDADLRQFVAEYHHMVFELFDHPDCQRLLAYADLLLAVGTLVDPLQSVCSPAPADAVFADIYLRLSAFFASNLLALAVCRLADSPGLIDDADLAQLSKVLGTLG